MDRLNQLYAQLVGQVRAMTPGSRIAAALLLAAVAISLGYLCVFSSADPGKTAAGPSARLRSAGSGLAEPDDPMEAAIEKDSILLLPDQRQALYKNGEEKSLEKEIADFFKDVAKATVNLTERVEIRNGRQRSVPVASVGVKMKPGARLSREVGVMICDYVAAAAGRDPADVVAFDPSHGTRFHGSRDGGAGRDEFANRQALEQECQEKIRRLLSSIPEVTVVVSARPASAADRREAPASAGPLAATANQPRQLPASDGDAAGASIRVAIRVPASHFERLWRERTAATRDSRSLRPDPAERCDVERREIERIKRLAASVLSPVDGAADRGDAVTVVSFPDFAPADTSPSRETPTATFRLAEYGAMLGPIGLAVVVFFAVRSFTRRAPSRAVARDAVEPRSEALPVVPAAAGRRDDPAGIDLDGQLARRLIERHQARSESSAAAPFGLLHKTDPRRIARILDGEQPQTIALVLSHLAPRPAGDVLACLASETQAEVVRRLVDLEQADPEVLHEIERSLTSRLAEEVPMQPRRVAGLAAVGGILEASRQHVGRTILGNLAASDKSLAERLESYVDRPTDGLALDDLAQLDLASRRVLCEAAGDELLALALVGAPPEIADPLLAAVPPPCEAAIRRSLECPQPTRLSDVDAAKDELAELARALAAAGQLALADHASLAVTR